MPVAGHGAADHPPAERSTRSGSEKRQRSHLVQVRCTPAERASITTAAERAGMAVGAFMRRQCLGAPGPRAQRRPPVEHAALAQLLAQLGKAGSNVNQVARIVNTTGDIPPGTAEAIAEVRAAAVAIMQVLGKQDV